MKYFCTFCNDFRPDSHIKKCKECGGDLHDNGVEVVCSCCGKVVSLTKDLVKEVKQEAKQVMEVITEILPQAQEVPKLKAS